MHFATLNDNLVGYRYRVGTGPVVVFANSLGSDPSIWDDVIAALPPTQAILTYDMRGHGVSGVTKAPYTIDLLADDLIALLDHLALQSVILSGISIGGLIAQAIALKRPDLLRGLVLNTTAVRIGTHDRWATRIAQVQADGFTEIADSIVETWLSESFRNRNPDAVAGHKTMLQRNSVTGYTNACAALRDADLSGQINDIPHPCICIAGGADPSVPPAQVQKLADAIPGARMVTLPDVGHLPCLEAPSDVARIIQSMIDDTAPVLDQTAAGMAVRRSVLGAAHVDRADAEKTAFDSAFQDLVTHAAWGTVWVSDAITRRERSMITLGLLAALGNFAEIPMHIRACARTGASQADIREVFQHVAIYAGVPRANHALKLAKQTFAETSDD